MFVDMDGLRINILRDTWKVLEAMIPLVDSYKRGKYDDWCMIHTEESKILFDSINDLRRDIGSLMCVFDDGISDLSHLLKHVPFIEYEEQTNDE